MNRGHLTSVFSGQVTSALTLVTAVDPGSAGAVAGLKPGDVMIRFDGRPVSTPQELSARLGSATAGKTVDLQIVRDRTPRALRATLADPGEAPEAEPQSANRSAGNQWGVELRRLTPRLARRLGVPSEEGVVVTHVRPDSPGARAGISAGDVIREVNRTSVNAVQDVEQSMSASGNGQEVLMRVERNGRRATSSSLLDRGWSCTWSCPSPPSEATGRPAGTTEPERARGGRDVGGGSAGLARPANCARSPGNPCRFGGRRSRIRTCDISLVRAAL